jgi:hypothetical protein
MFLGEWWGDINGEDLSAVVIIQFNSGFIL